jgi:anti-sigma factor RsiW
MNINRHNYEEFFLLYVDNELTAAQRKIVEAFVAVNPDLQEEFHLIQQSIFTADEKLDSNFITSLLKPVEEESSISQEQLLLYIDNELGADEQKAVEQAVAENTGLQKELHWLKRSTFEADKSVVFPDKSLLYKDARPARVFYMSTSARRWAAAAAVILLLGSAVWLMIGKPAGNNPLVHNPSVQTEKKNTADPKSAKEIIKEALVPEMPEEVATTAQDNHINNTTNNQTKNSGLTKNNLVKNQKEKIIPVTTKEEPFVAKVETPVTIVPENISGTPSNKTETPTVQPVTSTANTVSYASYNTDTNNENENTIFTEERQRRSGLRGLVKKVKRTFERNTGIQSGSSEVRFAVFAVNTQ